MAETKIRQALELLRERGWCKNLLEDDEGRMCINGAITADGFYNHEDVLALDAVARAEFPERDGPYPRVDFNNHPDTTFADVERVMEKAAVMREEAL